MSRFLEIALRNIARGFRVHPVRPKDKLPILSGWPDQATTNPVAIEQWAQEYPDANCGVAVGPDLCVLESDDLEKLKELLGPVEIPRTYTVQARENRPHFYFRPTTRTVQGGNRTLGGVFEFKASRLQVIGEGSTHPCGAVYRVIQEAPVIPMPDELMTVLVGLQAKGQQGKEAAPVEGNRNNYLTSIAGKLRNTGLSREALEVALLQHNADICIPPLDDEEVKHIAASVARYDVPEPAPEIALGRKDMSEDPRQPKDWREHYHSVDAHDHVGPPEFLIDGFLQRQAIMGIGAFVGQKKTLLALNVAWSLCSGEPLFGKFKVIRQPTRVLYLGPENGLISFASRVNSIGLRKYLGRTFFYTTMSMPEKLPLTALTGEEIAGAVIFIDTAIRYTEGNENDASQMKEFAELAFSLIRNGAEAVVMLHHSPKAMTKASELTLGNSMRGTGELSAFLSVALALRTQDMSDEYQSASLIRFVKQRDFEPRPPSFEVTTDRESCRMTFVDGSNGASVTKKTTANADGRDQEAFQLIQDNPKLSLNKIVAKLREIGIERGRTWVGNKRFELLGVGTKLSA